MAIVAFQNVTRVYTSGDHTLKVLDGVSFTLDEGRFAVILGPSGAGKSTLLHLLGGLDSPPAEAFGWTEGTSPRCAATSWRTTAPQRLGLFFNSTT